MNILKNRTFVIFVAKFIIAFCICYFGTLAIIGLSAPVGYYSPFVEKYLNYISWLRSSLLYGSQTLLNISGVDTYLASEYNIRKVNGRGIVIVYECVGYGILSFWAAFIIAQEGKLKQKILWWLGGSLVFWLLNVIRLSLLLVATNKGWEVPFGWDHHTWFSIVAYSAMLIMIWYFGKVSGKHTKTVNTQSIKNKS
jgi:exosortase/archaeosortase family protein